MGRTARLQPGSICYSTGALEIQKEFKSQPLIPGERVVSFIGVINIIVPPELSLNRSAIGMVTEWLEEGLGVEDISFNRKK